MSNDRAKRSRRGGATYKRHHKHDTHTQHSTEHSTQSWPRTHANNRPYMNMICTETTQISNSITSWFSKIRRIFHSVGELLFKLVPMHFDCGKRTQNPKHAIGEYSSVHLRQWAYRMYHPPPTDCYLAWLSKIFSFKIHRSSWILIFEKQYFTFSHIHTPVSNIFSDQCMQMNRCHRTSTYTHQECGCCNSTTHHTKPTKTYE